MCLRIVSVARMDSTRLARVVALRRDEGDCSAGDGANPFILNQGSLLGMQIHISNDNEWSSNTALLCGPPSVLAILEDVRNRRLEHGHNSF